MRPQASPPPSSRRARARVSWRQLHRSNSAFRWRSALRGQTNPPITRGLHHGGRPIATGPLWRTWSISAPHESGLGGCLAFPGGVGRDSGGLGQQRGIFLPEDFGAEPYRRIDLGLAEPAVGLAGGAQPIEQRARSGVEMVLHLAVGAERHLAHGNPPPLAPSAP